MCVKWENLRCPQGKADGANHVVAAGKLFPHRPMEVEAPHTSVSRWAETTSSDVTNTPLRGREEVERSYRVFIGDVRVTVAYIERSLHTHRLPPNPPQVCYRNRWSRGVYILVLIEIKTYPPPSLLFPVIMQWSSVIHVCIRLIMFPRKCIFAGFIKRTNVWFCLYSQMFVSNGFLIFLQNLCLYVYEQMFV